jgi:ABC-type branched-subunit amino acid transport system substrate-binding protein
VLGRIWLLALCGLLVVACCPPGSVQPTVKLGLSAPFEGRYRDLGYEALYAVRLAVRQRNEAGGVGGDRHLVELVALNDLNEAAEAIEQARKMAVDPDVLAVLGGWSPATAGAAAPVYRQQGLAFVAPPLEVVQATTPAGEAPDPAFAEAYRALSGGVDPGPVAVWAYAEAQRMLDAVDAALLEQGEPSREAVRSRLAQGAPDG